ncbi:MAG: cellulase family glycosylhydrolase, partial [Bacilli bacterium]|nr:cellulase family glycosylhydrolase [Bacilli bacterium]
MANIRGLNIGGWLVLEKWMTPSLYQGFDAEDEFHLLQKWGVNAEEKLENHRNNFIKEEDFKWIKEYGIDTLRIPVGHWLFDAQPPYFSAKRHLDRAFEWALKYGLSILLDVHAAPGCQNGFDNGGLSGVCEWHLDKQNIDQTIQFIETLCRVYQGHPSLVGIQLLNEPSVDIELKILEDFYVRGYETVRKQLGKDIYVVFHDGFRLNVWENFFRKNQFENVYLDTHMYQVFSGEDQRSTVSEIIQKVSVQRTKELHEVKQYVDVIVGEWSLGIPDKAKNEASDSFQLEVIYRAVGNSLLTSFESVSGWFFWNYKLADDSVQQNGGWSFRR